MTDTIIISDKRIIFIGRVFFAIGIFGIGAQHFIFSHFIRVIVPWTPAWMPFNSLFPYLIGAFLVAAGSIIIFGKRPRLVSTVSGLLFLFLFIIIQIPFNAINNLLVIGAWTNAFKEFAFFGSAFIVAGTLPKENHNIENPGSLISRIEEKIIPLAKYPLSIMVIIFGTDHFIYTKFIASLVPKWIPDHIFWAYLAGTALIASGIGIILNVKARLAAALLGAMIFTWVIILHIPRAIADPSGLMGNEWTSVFEALAFSGIAFILAQILPKKNWAGIIILIALFARSIRDFLARPYKNDLLLLIITTLYMLFILFINEPLFETKNKNIKTSVLAIIISLTPRFIAVVMIEHLNSLTVSTVYLSSHSFRMTGYK